MKKITWTIAAFVMYLSVNGGFAQTSTNDTSYYKTRKLKVDEVNIVAGYYHQEGNLSPVTGGIGSEKLTDFETTVDLKLTKQDKKDNEHTILVEAGISHYTSASSDKIDPSTVSSASSRDTRYFPSVAYNVDNENKGIGVGANVSYSKEFDYVSYGYGINFTKTSKNKNSDLSVRLNAYNDIYTIIRPIEFRDPVLSPPGKKPHYTYPTKPRDSYDAAFVFSHVINKRLQMALLADIAYQTGFLSTPFHRVYFNDGSEGLEVLPNTHLKIPVGIRVNGFIGDRIIIRAYYRYFQDDWGLKSHTANIEVPIKLTPFISISPFYRFYIQTAVNYFAPYKQNDALSTYHTTDDDLSGFSSNFIGLGIRLSPAKGIFGIKKFNMLELRYGFYKRSNGLVSSVVSMNLRFK